MLVKLNMFPPAASRGASIISMNVALPALIFANIVPSFTSANISAIGPMFLIAGIYQLLGFIMGIIIREVCFVPRNFWQGIVVLTGMSNWGNLRQCKPRHFTASLLTSDILLCIQRTRSSCRSCSSLHSILQRTLLVSAVRVLSFLLTSHICQPVGVSYVSIFSVCYHIVFWIGGAASSLAWDYLPGVPQGEEAERRVSWKERPIGHLVARTLHLAPPPPAPLPSESAGKDEEAFSADAKDDTSSVESLETPVLDVPRIVVHEEPANESDVQLTRRTSNLPAVTHVRSRRLTIAIPTTPLRPSVPATPVRPSVSTTPMRLSVPSTPAFATAPASPLRSGYPTSPVRSIASIAATTPIRSIHSIHSLEDPAAVAVLDKASIVKPRHWVFKVLEPLSALLKPVTMALAISLPIALVVPLKALFVDTVAQGGPNWHGPDGRPPLAFVMDTGTPRTPVEIPFLLNLHSIPAPHPASARCSKMKLTRAFAQRNSSTRSRCRSR